ncbi:Nek2, partial [Acrasis kona]
YLVEGLITEEEFLNENSAIEQQAILARNQRQLEKLNSLLSKGIISEKDYNVYVARLEPQVQGHYSEEEQQAAFNEMQQQIEAYSHERIQLYESIQLHQTENEQLKKDNVRLNGRVKVLEEQLLKLKGSSMYSQLQELLRRLERASHDRSMRQQETDELIGKSTKANEKFLEAKSSLRDRVNRLLDLQQSVIEADVVQARDESAILLKQTTQEALSKLEEEVKESDEGKHDWVKLLEQSQKLLEQETQVKDRIVSLQEQKKVLNATIEPELSTMETLREELEKIIKELKQSRLESGRRSREARMLEMTIEELEDNDAPTALIQAKRDEIENSKAMQRRADERAFQLRVQLVEKSRAEHSLPEYQLLAQLTNTKAQTDRTPATQMIIRDYVVEKEMSVGAQARVFLCKSQKNQQQVVVKAYIIRDALSNFDEGIKECRVVQSINHPNVVTIIEFFHIQHDKLGACFCIVMPYYSDGDLETMISRARRDAKYLPKNVVTRMMLQLANGLKAIHAAKLIHRDLKPQNIFINPETNSFIIGDFGLVKTSNTKVTKTSKAGTEDYMSPEMKSSKQRYTEKSDIWSLGCIMYDVMSLKHCNMVHETLEAIVEGTLDELIGELQSEMRRSGQYPETLIQLVMKMLNRSPTDRPSAESITTIRDLMDEDNEPSILVNNKEVGTKLPTQAGAPLKRRASMLLRQNSSTTLGKPPSPSVSSPTPAPSVVVVPSPTPALTPATNPSPQSSPRSKSDYAKNSNFKETLQNNKLVRDRSEAVKARQSAPVVQSVSAYQDKVKAEPKPISNNVKDKFESITKREEDQDANKRNTISFASKPVSDVKARWEQKMEQNKNPSVPSAQERSSSAPRVLSSMLNKFKKDTPPSTPPPATEKSPRSLSSAPSSPSPSSPANVEKIPSPPVVEHKTSPKETPAPAALPHKRQDSIPLVESEGETSTEEDVDDDDSDTESDAEDEQSQQLAAATNTAQSTIPLVIVDAPPSSPASTAAATNSSTAVTTSQILDDDLDEYINMFEDNKPSLTKIDFGNVKTPFKQIHSDQIQDLAECWGENETVLTVSMKGKGVSNIVLSYLCPQIAYNLTMENWDLSDNPDIDDLALKQLEAFVGKNKAVEKLTLSGCSLSEKSMNTLLSTAKKNNSKLVIMF